MKRHILYFIVQINHWTHGLGPWMCVESAAPLRIETGAVAVNKTQMMDLKTLLAGGGSFVPLSEEGMAKKMYIPSTWKFCGDKYQRSKNLTEWAWSSL